MSQLGVSANRLELLQIAEAVAREKSIDKSIVIEAMEEAIQRAAKARYGADNDIRAAIDHETGEIHLQRFLEVVEEIDDENRSTQILVEDAKAFDNSLEIGSFYKEDLPPLEYGRVSAQNAKQVILQKVREAERDHQYNEFIGRVGEIANVHVKRVEHGHVIVDLGSNSEGIIRRNETLPRESFRFGDRTRAYIYEVRRENRGPQIFLSRTRPEFMAKLFFAEVPELYDGIVELKAVARDPGSRAKIAVSTNDSSIDPVGACVGLRGARVQAVVNELSGEKIDVILWSEDAAAFIVNALAPAEVLKVVLDEDAEKIEVVVPNEQLSLAIGRRGQNVRLATQLTGWNIDIMTDEEETERRQAEFVERSALFIEALNIDEVIAQILVSDGFSSVEEVAYVPVEDIAAIEGFEEETAAELQGRAQEYLANIEAKLEDRRKELGVEDDLANIDGLTPAMLVRLGENDVKTMEDMAGCVPDDLLGWNERKEGKRVHYDGFLEGFDLTREDADTLILIARLQIGWISEEDILAMQEAEAEEEEVPEGEISEEPAVLETEEKSEEIPETESDSEKGVEEIGDNKA